MSSDQSKIHPLPPVLRLAGLWLIWSAWCSASGWLLSAVHQLNGFGYAMLLPVLPLVGWLWLKSTASDNKTSACSAKKYIRRFRRPAALVYCIIVLLSLLGG